MADEEMLRAVCCLAGADGDLTVEELTLLGRLARHVGLERAQLNAMIDSAMKEPDFREQQAELVRHDVDRALTELIRLIDEDDALQEGHGMMLMWRVATKMDVNADHFEQLLASATRSD
jgi:hypothetical protein